ncbi:MAG: hypothetical protein MK086_04655 [Flavobacteriales bacterium]|nr:hypothetical protein [Flavobacteriales bacterium]
MTTIFKKTVDSIYTFLLADAAGEFTASPGYKACFVLLSIAMLALATYAFVFMQS